MVRRVISCSFIIVLLSCLCLHSFAYDVAQTNNDLFGFSYNNGPILFSSQFVEGQEVSVDNQQIQLNSFNFYIPCSNNVESVEFTFTLCVVGGFSVNSSSVDYGTLIENNYSIAGYIDDNSKSLYWLTSSNVSGSSARYVTYKVLIWNLPAYFDYMLSTRYIRLSMSLSSDTKLCTWLNRTVNNTSYTLTGTEGNTTGQVTSGALSCSGYYITGSLKSMYYNGSGTSTFNGSLLNGTTGTGGYLHVPAHNLTSNASSPLKFSVVGGNISGSLTPDSNTNIDRTYTNVATMAAIRTYNDADMIEAINDASDRNHTDITNFSDRNHADLAAIGEDLQKLVDHQEQVTQTGNDIGSTTSSSSISNTSGNLSSGVSGLNSTLSTASDVSSFVTASTPYINFIGALFPVIIGWGDGVLAWAIVAIIAISVFLYILKKVSE